MEGDPVKTNAGKPDQEAGAPDSLGIGSVGSRGEPRRDAEFALQGHTHACDWRWALLLNKD